MKIDEGHLRKLKSGRDAEPCDKNYMALFCHRGGGGRTPPVTTDLYKEKVAEKEGIRSLF